MIASSLALPVDADIEPDLSVQLPRSATVGEVEELMVASQTESAVAKTLELDFTHSEFIEVATLILLIATISGRKRMGLRTIIKLPLDKRPRDFLRLWQFPQAVRNVTGTAFHRVACRKEDEKYFGENTTLQEHTYSGAYVVVDDGIRRLISTRFFSLQTYALFSEHSQTRLVEHESGRWNGQLVKAVLGRQLQGPNGYVSSRIVFESMTNAIRHANASFIVSGSMFARRGMLRGTQQGAGGFFTLVYWDDGESIIDTLKTALLARKPIRHPSVCLPPEKFHLQILNGKDIVMEEDVMSDYTPELKTIGEKLLLAATFPGITRDVTAKGHASPETKKSHPQYDSPGMGLPILLNTVIDIFGGSIGFRTKDHYMSIKKDPESGRAKYLARVHKRSAAVTGFIGNMLTIRLPVGSAKSA